MTRVLEFAPMSPFHDLEAKVAQLRKNLPGITEMGVNQAVKMMLDSSTPKGYKPRVAGRIIYLFGADIMTAQLDTIPAWPLLSDAVRARLLDHPTEGGTTLEERVAGDADPKQAEIIQAGLANDLYRRSVNRSVLISPRGLSRTYVWRHENDWLQEVTDADAELIMNVPGSNQKFLDRGLHSPYVDVRSYENPNIVVQRHIAPASDTDYILRQLKAAPSWQGTDLPTQ